MGAYLVLVPSLQRDLKDRNSREAAQSAVAGDSAFPFT
jgi:hypothetical protein